MTSMIIYMSKDTALKHFVRHLLKTDQDKVILSLNIDPDCWVNDQDFQ